MCGDSAEKQRRHQRRRTDLPERRRGSYGGAAVLVGSGVSVGQLTNQASGATISGGTGGFGTLTLGAGGTIAGAGGVGGAAMSNAGTIATLTNSGNRFGGGPAEQGRLTAAPAARACRTRDGATLSNSGSIDGGAGGNGGIPTRRRGRRGRVERGTDHVAHQQRFDHGRLGRNGGQVQRAAAGRSGVSNSGTITKLTNSGTISGGSGGGVTQRRGRRGGVEFRNDHDADQHGLDSGGGGGHGTSATAVSAARA